MSVIGAERDESTGVTPLVRSTDGFQKDYRDAQSASGRNGWSVPAFGAATAYAVPQNSPYATMVPPDAVDGYVSDGPGYRCQGYGQDVGCPADMTEGRSAFVDPEYTYGGSDYIDSGYGYSGYGYHGGSRAMGGHFEAGHNGGGAGHGR